MGKKKLVELKGDTLEWDCPACKVRHSVWVDGNHSTVWTWNSSYSEPTLQESVEVVGPEVPNPDGDTGVCHFYVVFGRISFLSDCTHAIAGKVVDMTPIE